jgi:hypothetical protein
MAALRISFLLAILSASPAAAQEGWVFDRARGDPQIAFGGKDTEQGGLGYLNHSFSCQTGGKGGTLLINEGMPERLKGFVRMRLETGSGAFDIRAEILTNEEAGSSGLSADLTAQQLRAAVTSRGQVTLVNGRDRIRVGLRGSEPYLARFLEACGLK